MIIKAVWGARNNVFDGAWIAVGIFAAMPPNRLPYEFYSHSSARTDAFAGPYRVRGEPLANRCLGPSRHSVVVACLRPPLGQVYSAAETQRPLLNIDKRALSSAPNPRRTAAPSHRGRELRFRRRGGHVLSRFSKRPRPPRVPSRGVAAAPLLTKTPTRAYSSPQRGSSAHHGWDKERDRRQGSTWTRHLCLSDER